MVWSADNSWMYRTTGRAAIRAKPFCVPTLLNIVHENASLLVVNKPAGLVCHPTKPDGYSSLISRVRTYLGEGMQPHLINRLDRETSGLVLVAKDAAAARELGRLWEQRKVEKRYLAIVWRHVREAEGVIDAPLGKDEHSAVAIKDCVRPDGAPARTEFVRLRNFTRSEGDFSLLRVTPQTGRKHQIRIHLAHVGHPIVGDKLYGDDERHYLDLVYGRLGEAQWATLILRNHALHASEVAFLWRDQDWSFWTEPEPEFNGFLGEASA